MALRKAVYKSGSTYTEWVGRPTAAQRREQEEEFHAEYGGAGLQ